MPMITQKSDGTLVRDLGAAERDLYGRLFDLTQALTDTEGRVDAETEALTKQLSEITAELRLSRSADPISRYFGYKDLLHKAGEETTDVTTGRKVWSTTAAGPLASTSTLDIQPGQWNVTMFVTGPVRATVGTPGGQIKSIDDRGAGWRTVQFSFSTNRSDVNIVVDALGAAAIDYLAMHVSVASSSNRSGGSILVDRLTLTATTAQTYTLPLAIDGVENVVFLGGLLLQPGIGNQYTITTDQLAFLDTISAGVIANLLFTAGTSLPLSRFTKEIDFTRYSVPLPEGVKSGDELVFVNGLLASPRGDHDYVIRNNNAVFVDQLRVGEIVDILYLDDLEMKLTRLGYVANGIIKQFALPEVTGTSFEMVFVNGQLMAPGLDYDYVISGGNVIFKYIPGTDSDVTFVTLSLVG